MSGGGILAVVAECESVKPSFERRTPPSISATFSIFIKPLNEKAIPRVIGTAMKDGAYRYGGENGIALIKEGDTVRLYDYASRNVSRPRSVREANAALSQQRSAGENAAASEERRYAIPVGDEIVDARTVTEEDVRTLLQRVQSGEYRKKLISR